MSDETYFFPVTVPYQGPGPDQSFGPRSTGSDHKGLDLTPPRSIRDDAEDFPILAYRGGVVTLAQHNTRYGAVFIRHDDGTQARYLHNSSVSVVEEATVVAGQQIASMGGRGPLGSDQFAIHLHFELLDAAGNHVDPGPSLLDTFNNPLSTLQVVSHPDYGPPASEGPGL
jgi:murein DD-endopeptidase MepM/ murein hydrolase activator NlpD